MDETHDVIVIGGGHAGCEAAAAAARIGARTALVTQSLRTIGEMSLQPGHRRPRQGPPGPRDRCPRWADGPGGRRGRHPVPHAEPQQGPAVRGPRSQVDRRLYRRAIQSLLARQANLTPGRGIGRGPDRRRGRTRGVVLGDGRRLAAAAVVLTTGTFLKGVIHRGEERMPAGRVGEAPAIGLARPLSPRTLPSGA